MLETVFRKSLSELINVNIDDDHLGVAMTRKFSFIGFRFVAVWQTCSPQIEQSALYHDSNIALMSTVSPDYGKLSLARRFETHRHDNPRNHHDCGCISARAAQCTIL
jgi:hypothetical protein